MMGSVLLHATVAVLLMVSWNFTRDLKVGSVVPVTIVSSAPASEPKPAEAAPVEQTAQAEEPVPEAAQPATPPAPEPKPVPTPPKPTPKAAPPPPTPVPTPTKAPPKPVAAPAKPEKSLDLDALSASISKMTKAAAAKPSSAPKGPARAETAQVVRSTLGTGVAAAAMSGLADELQRRWNPNCDVEGGRDVQLRVTFTIGPGGQVVGDATSQIKSGQPDVARAAAERAVRAVYAAAPFRSLPREFYGEKIAVNFNAREACS